MKYILLIFIPAVTFYFFSAVTKIFQIAYVAYICDSYCISWTVNASLFSDSNMPPQLLTIIYKGKLVAIVKTMIFPIFT